jgi:hypothetical protein
MWGQKIQTKLAIDGHWVGINRGNTYFAVHVDPGEHALCAAAENRSVMTMTFEAGRTYYLQQQIRTGWNKARTRLVPLTESEGLAALDKTHVSTFAEK